MSDLDHEGLIREANSATDKDDDKLIYDRDQFRVDKARRQYEFYYHDRKIVVERGINEVDLDACALRVRTVLEAQGLLDMVMDHCPALEEIICEFYANLYKRRSNSFRTCVRKKKIVVTRTLISNIMEAPRVCNPEYP